MPDIIGGEPRHTEPVGLPAGLAPDPLDQLARKVTGAAGGARLAGTFASGRVVWLEDAKAVREQAVREAVARILAELEKVSAQLIEANEALECWGAFDYLLQEKAEKCDLHVEGLSPIEVVEELIEGSPDWMEPD